MDTDKLEREIAKLKEQRLAFGLSAVGLGLLALLLSVSIPVFWLIVGYLGGLIAAWRLTGGD
jgi:uncharacterized RDD family membrane protein YckC